MTFTPAPSDVEVEPIESANIDWEIMAPTRCEPPMCQLYQLSDGTYTIDDLADMLEVLAEQTEYRRRLKVAQDREAKRK